MSSIFRAHLEKGIVLLPQRDYKPLVKWGRYFKENIKPTESELKYFETFFPDTIEYVCVCGKVSGITWVDIDVNDQAAIQKLRNLWKPAIERFGSKGIGFGFKYNNEVSEGLGDDGNGHPIVEIKSDGTLITLPPSKLPEKKQKGDKTQYYTYLNNKDLLNVELTELPTDYRQDLLRVFKIIEKEPEYKPEYVSTSYSYDKATEEEVISALSYLSSDIHYEDWALIGGCIYQDFQMAGFYIFDDWSATAGKRYNKRECYEQYKKGYQYTRCGTSAIFKKAVDKGYKKELTEVAETRVIDIKDWNKKKLVKKAEQELSKDSLESDLIQNAPPLIKGLVEWMCRTSTYSQPMLSLGAVVTTLGFIMGRKYILNSKTRTATYSVCLAKSQHGKEHVKAAVRCMLKEAGMSKNYERTWSSGAAIESALEAKKGEVLYCTEEMGILMRGMTGKFADKNQNDAQAAITELFTANHYTGKGYANRAERPTLDVEYPNVVIVGFAQPDVFFESVSSAEALTGFLNRVFIFQGLKIRPKHNKNIAVDEINKMPADLSKAIQSIVNNHSVYVSEKGGFRIDEDNKAILLKPVEYDEETAFYKESIWCELDDLFNKYEQEGNKLENIIGRAVELMERLALIGSCGNTITMKEFKWAQSVVEYCLGLMCSATQDLIGDSDFERTCNKVLKFIVEHGEVAQSKLGQRFRSLNSDELNKIIIKLLQMEEIVAIKEKASGHGRERTVFRSMKAQDLRTSNDKFALTGKSMQGAF